MANHVKPTKEELKRKAEEAAAEAERLKNNPPSASPSPSHAPTPSPSPSPSSAPSASPSPSKGAPSASPSTSPSQPSASPSPSEEDETEKLRKKASASSREAQVLQSRTKKYDNAVEEAEAISEPEDTVMEEKYGKQEWEEMSNSEKRLAKENWVNTKRFEIMAKASKEGRDIQQWNEKVDKFISDPKTLNKHKELEGKQEEFKEFASKPTRRGLDFEDLVLAFLGQMSKNPPKKNKGQMFERGTAGKKDKPQPKDDKLTPEQGRALRKTDFKKWKQLLKAGKIKNE